LWYPSIKPDEISQRMASNGTRILTGLVGLPVSKNPVTELVRYYARMLRKLQSIPKDSAYRVSTEKLIKERITKVEASKNPEDVERAMGVGVCEDSIEDAKRELHLVETMKVYKSWGPLEEEPPLNQWKWPM